TMSSEELVREHARPGAEIVAWPPASMADIEAAYDRAGAEGLIVARLHGGDPAVYARLAEEIERVAGRGLEWEIVPGVTAATAAAAALGWELVSEADRRPLIVASSTQSGGRPSPELRAAARLGHALALYMTGPHADDLERRLLDAGYPPETPCAV